MEFRLIFGRKPTQMQKNVANTISQVFRTRQEETKRVPDKFEGVIRPAAESEVENIWVNFSFYIPLSLVKHMITDYFCKSQECINFLLSLGDKCIGYKMTNVTLTCMLWCIMFGSFWKLIKQ